MKYPVKITVNGKAFTQDVEPRLLLVHFLRDTAGLTGTKVGCDTSQCGVVHGAARRRRHEVLHAASRCRPTARRSRRSKVLPRASTLHQLQEAFWATHGLQCGFCTPGMLLAAHELLRVNPTPTRTQIRHGLEGNLCRCTGYQNIVRAVQQAAALAARLPRESGHERHDDRVARIRIGHPPARGSAAHHRDGALHRRHRAARHRSRGDPAKPARPRAYQADRHVPRQSRRRRGRCVHRRRQRERV